MSKAKKIIIAVIVLVILAVIATGLFLIFYSGNSYGIPNGTYAPLDENGKKLDVVLEDMWQIDDNKAEYRYAVGKIIEEDGKVFYYFRDNEKYEMIYDKKTKILTIVMPEDYPKESEVKPMKFMRKTIFD